MKKNKGKKGDDELLENQLKCLKIDIEVLENDIHLEELREVKAYDDLKILEEKTKDEQIEIDKEKESENKIIKMKSEALEKEEDKKAKEIEEKRDTISKLEKLIVDLQTSIEDDKLKYAEEEVEKNEQIKAQENLLQQMTTKFQHILENTASKLQERVKSNN